MCAVFCIISDGSSSSRSSNRDFSETIDVLNMFWLYLNVFLALKHTYKDINQVPFVCGGGAMGGQQSYMRVCTGTNTHFYSNKIPLIKKSAWELHE